MVRSLMIASLLILAALAPASTARADGWLPVWNPFAGWGSSSAPPPMVAPQPSLWQRMSSATSQSWNNTTQLLNPWSSQAAAAPQRSSIGTQRVYSPTAPRQAAPTESWLPWNWFLDDDDPEPQFDTPSDWLSQPRPG